MPRGDRTGPNGAGAMSGRRQGNCRENTMPGSAAAKNFEEGHAFYGWGNGQGRVGNRFGGGFGRRGFLSSSTIDEKTILENQINELKLHLNGLENQINNLEK